MTIEEMKKKKQEKGYSYEQLSQRSGVPVGTLQKIFRGETTRPRYDTLRAIEQVLNRPDDSFYAQLTTDYYPQRMREAQKLREAQAVYGTSPMKDSAGKRQGEYTIEDYRALPDDERFELIDGVIFKMDAPTTYHQLAAAELHRQIANFIIDRNGSCVPFISPVDVQLDEDNRTMLQPDVIIMCDPKRILTKNIFGAPDFAAEVLSPSTKSKDSILKLSKYNNAGVREYWMIDPYKRIILTYDLQNGDSPAIYPIDAEVPVHLYDGELKICLARLNQWLSE